MEFPVAMADASGLIFGANQAFLVLLKLDSSALKKLALNIFEAAREERTALEDSMARLCSWNGAIHLQAPEGGFHGQVTVVPLLGADESSAGFSIIHHSVSRSYQSHLRESRNRYRAMAENLPGGLVRYRLNTDGTDSILYVSKGNEELWEMSRQAVYRDLNAVWKQILAEDLPGIRASILESARTLSKWDYQWRIRMDDGRIKWVHGRGLPFREPGGATTWDTMLFDITEQKKLEQDYTTLIEKLRLAYKSARMGLWEWDPSSGELHWDEGTLALYGLSEDEFHHRYEDWASRVLLEDVQQSEHLLAEALSGTGIYDTEFRAILPDGAIRYIRGCATVIRNEQGVAERVIGFNMDVSDLKKAERIARQASEAKSMFLANMSHEIRTPLNSIVGFSRLLLDTEMTTEQKYFMEGIYHSARSLSDLVSDILDFSRIEAGALDLNLTPSNTRELIESSFAICEYGARNRNLELKLTLQEKLPETILVDEIRFRQVLVNLLGNAIKFTEQGTVELAVDSRRIVKETGSAQWAVLNVHVRDTGIGMREQTKENLFEAFAQGDPTASRRFGGTGLGLSIAQGIVGKMGGSIQFESEPGKGSHFWFSIEVEEVGSFGLETEEAKHQLSQEALEMAASLLSSKQLTVLIAEDNPLNQAVIRAILGKYIPNAIILTADNGAKAVQEFLSHKPDVVLMDVQMPEMDGYEATAAIRREEQSHTPIIALTAGARREDRNKCLDAGMDFFLPKPVSQEDLLFTLARIVG